MKNMKEISLLILIGLITGCSGESDENFPIPPDEPIVTPGDEEKDDIVASHDFMLGALFSFQKIYEMESILIMVVPPPLLSITNPCLKRKSLMPPTKNGGIIL